MKIIKYLICLLLFITSFVYCQRPIQTPFLLADSIFLKTKFKFTAPGYENGKFLGIDNNGYVTPQFVPFPNFAGRNVGSLTAPANGIYTNSPMWGVAFTYPSTGRAIWLRAQNATLNENRTIYLPNLISSVLCGSANYPLYLDNDGIMNILRASASSSGYLHSSDFVSFSNKANSNFDNITGIMNNLIPASNHSYNIGSNVTKWNEVYTRTVYLDTINSGIDSIYVSKTILPKHAGWYDIGSTERRFGAGYFVFMDLTEGIHVGVPPNRLFVVDEGGDIGKIKGVSYSFPATQGAPNTYLKNNGQGDLTWSKPNTYLFNEYREVLGAGDSLVFAIPSVSGYTYDGIVLNGWQADSMGIGSLGWKKTGNNIIIKSNFLGDNGKRVCFIIRYKEN